MDEYGKYIRPTGTTQEEKLSELVFQALGEASMCWEVMPHSRFDDTRATEIGDKLIADLEELFAHG